jgi:NitT/TauT family transport system substrate-binding protein
MMLQALSRRNLKPDFWELVSQSPEIGSTNLQEKRIDAHGDFVPFAELLPYRGIARKIYDGAETKHPTFHGVVARKDFGQQYPEVVVAYIQAMLDANAWVRENPRCAAEQIEGWTKINKEVVYMFLGPSGVHTLDPTIKAQWVAALNVDYATLQGLGMIKPLNLEAWVNDRYVKAAFTSLGLDYEKQRGSLSGYSIQGDDPICKTPIKDPSQAGEVWLKAGDIVAFSSAACTLKAVKHYGAAKQDVGAVYVIDRALGIKLFADSAYYTLSRKDPRRTEVVPYLLKRDAQHAAAQSGGKVVTYAEALAATSEALP